MEPTRTPRVLVDFARKRLERLLFDFKDDAPPGFPPGCDEKLILVSMAILVADNAQRLDELEEKEAK